MIVAKSLEFEITSDYHYMKCKITIMNVWNLWHDKLNTVTMNNMIVYTDEHIQSLLIDNEKLYNDICTLIDGVILW